MELTEQEIINVNEALDYQHEEEAGHADALIATMTIQDAENKILALPPDGPYSHNIASLVLGQVASEHGYAAANALVVSLGLTTAYGIKPTGEGHEQR